MKKPFTINMLPDEVFKKWFVQKARSPQAWIIQSKYLHHAADYLLKLHQKAEDKQIKLLLKELKENEGQLRTGSRPATKLKVELIHDTSVIAVYRMLMGYSIENLSKAILIKKKPDLIKKDGAFGDKNTIKRHLSIEMIRECGIKLKAQEKDTVQMLSWYVLWAGRYPIPLKVKDTKPYKRSDGLWFQPGDLQMQDETQLIENIYIVNYLEH